MPRPLQLDILVSLVGELRWGMEQALVTAYKISPVSCQAEFDAHLLEIAVLPLRLRKMQERAADIARAAFMGQDLTGVHNRNQLQTRSAQLLPNNVQHQVWINTILGFGVSLCQGQPFWRLEQQACWNFRRVSEQGCSSCRVVESASSHWSRHCQGLERFWGR